MKCKLTFLLCLPFTLLLSQANDQYIIAAQGDFTKGETMSISWTIGDLVTEAGVLHKGIITQGFQQPRISILELTAKEADLMHTTLPPTGTGADITSTTPVEFNASVYPNPSGADVQLNIENSQQEYYLDLFDQSGNLLSRSLSSSPQEVIRLNDLPAAQYVLRIGLIESKQSKVFRIIKSN